MASASSDDHKDSKDEPSPSSPSPKEPEKEERESSVVHKTKTIQFCGRTTPIILQNDNGPCPLLAICNVLLLKNQLSLNPDISDVSQEKLLSLIAERLIDSNSNVNNKDAEYVENQQQNMADVLDLVPQLTTGIDVNTKFRRIDDFEFTRECAIFDLLDIPLYHGWLVDPQDRELAEAIGSKSYNAIMSDLVLLETRKMENEEKNKVDEDGIDFAAATTATLGVPSPSLSSVKSFDDSPRSTSSDHILRKGDFEEEAEVLTALKLSQNELSSNIDAVDTSASADGNVHKMESTPANIVNVSEGHNLDEVCSLEPSVSGSIDMSGKCESNLSFEDNAASFTRKDAPERGVDQLPSVQPVESSFSNDLSDGTVNTVILNDATPALFTFENDSADQEVAALSNNTLDSVEESRRQSGDKHENLIVGSTGSESSSGRIPITEAVESFTLSLSGSEPIYEGEDRIQDSGNLICEDGEPIYEGEVVLAEQADKATGAVCDGSSKDTINHRQGELISNFLKTNASQLTFHGLFSLQEGLNERELCVFFRNNHFSTMFKFEKELYLLATDQGYLNQPDLVWEKLNEVNGDTLFMTSNFKEFRLEGSNNDTWDQQNAVASTADYLASIDSSSPDGSNMNSDLQLAIALQQQEFEQQPPPQRNSSQQPSHQPSVAGGSSRLITGPQVPRSSAKATSSTSRPDQKSKDKSSNCKLM